MYRLASRCNDAIGKANALGAARLLSSRAGGFLHRQVVGSNKSAMPSNHSHFAHFGHGSQSAVELGDNFVFVSPQQIDIDLWLTKVNSKCFQVLHLVHYRRNMKQCFRRDAPDIQTYPAKLCIAFDKHNLESEICRAKRSRIAARASADYQQVALDVGISRKTYACHH